MIRMLLCVLGPLYLLTAGQMTRSLAWAGVCWFVAIVWVGWTLFGHEGEGP